MLFDMNRFVHKRFLIFAAVFFLLVFFCPDVHGEMVMSSWNGKGEYSDLFRPIPAAINVYARKGTVPQVLHEAGRYGDVTYEMIRVDPSEDTFLQVDYDPSMVFLDMLYDHDLVGNGYIRVAGMNSCFFINNEDDPDYGRPSGAVRTGNDWAYWNGEELAPAYGNGFATAYFNNTDMVLKYHGWHGSAWLPGDDGIWTGHLTGIHAYGIDARFGVSGSYTYYSEGEQIDITGGESGGQDYRSGSRAVSLLAQKEDRQYLLITFYGKIGDDEILAFLEKEKVRDAIRLDGGGSTQMIYESSLVNLPYVRSDYSSRIHDTPLFGWDEVSRGYQPEEHVLTSRKVSLTVVSDRGELYRGSVYAGTSLRITDREGRTVLDSMVVTADTVLRFALTDGPSYFRDGTLCFHADEPEQEYALLKSGSETELVLMVFPQDIIPAEDVFSVRVADGQNSLWSYRGREKVTLRVLDHEGKEVQIYTPGYEFLLKLQREEVDGMEFTEWKISGNDTETVFRPVYRKTEDKEPTWKDRILSLLRKIFGIHREEE